MYDSEMEQSTAQVRVNQVVGNPYNRTDPVDKVMEFSHGERGRVVSSLLRELPFMLEFKPRKWAIGGGFAAPIAGFTMVRTGDYSGRAWERILIAHLCHEARSPKLMCNNTQRMIRSTSRLGEETIMYFTRVDRIEAD